MYDYCENFMAYYPYTVGWEQSEAYAVVLRIIEEGVAFVAEGDKGVVGVIGGLVAPGLYTPSKLVGFETFIWIEEEARGLGASKQLLEAFETECKARGCSYVVLSSTPHTEGFKGYMKANGYTEVETSFIKGT